jgi:hypothetical protein
MDEALGADWAAYAAILAWPLVALILYRFRPSVEATAWTVLGALLFLPPHFAIKIPMVPAIDKDSVASVSALVGCIFCAKRTKRPRTATMFAGALGAVYVVSPGVTSMLNGDVIVAGLRSIPGVGYYDGISAVLSQAIPFIPFLMGCKFMREAEDMVVIVRTLVLAGLMYSLLMLFEIRMSPHLCQWIYGYFPSSFPVEMRYGGFRPVVFMNNGLTAAFFLSTAVIGSIAFWRTRNKITRLTPSFVSSYLGIVLILCKSAGALVYAIIIGAFVRWCQPRFQIRVAVFIVVVAITYPVLRMTDYFPDTQLLQTAGVFNQDRADSLKMRFDQEQQLLARASERFWFGWGRYGRSRVYDASGNDLSITDGQWIIELGQFGFVGFIGQFGLLVLPVIFSARISRYASAQREFIFLACLTLLVALTVVEQLPNASISPWSWLLAGVLLGQAERIMATKRWRVVRAMVAGNEDQKFVPGNKLSV